MEVTAPPGADEGALGGLGSLWHAVHDSATGIRTAAAIVRVTGYLVISDQRLVKTILAWSDEHERRYAASSSGSMTTTSRTTVFMMVSEA